MLEDSAAAVLVTESQLMDRLPSNLPTLICLDRDRKLLESANGFVTQSGRRRISSLDGIGKAIQVEIVLNPQFRIGNEIRAVREALEHQELHAGRAHPSLRVRNPKQNHAVAALLQTPRQ